MTPDSVLLALTIVYGKPMFCYLLHTAFPPSEDVDPWEIISQQLKLKTQTAQAVICIEVIMKETFLNMYELKKKSLIIPGWNECMNGTNLKAILF